MTGSNIKIPINRIKITSIFDNKALSPGLKTAWGFAAIIEGTGPAPILFDTGSEGLKLLKNMNILGFNPKSIPAVVLSHEHWDHIGGIEALLKENPDMEIFIPSIFSKGMKKVLKKAAKQVTEITGPKEILPGVFTTGVMGNAIPEQSLVLNTDHGGILITGCAHPGIVNIVERAIEITGRIFMVIGGFHLNKMPDSEIKKIINKFKALGIKYTGPCHCTGEAAQSAFQQAYRDDYLDIRTGTRLNLGDLTD